MRGLGIGGILATAALASLPFAGASARAADDCAMPVRNALQRVSLELRDRQRVQANLDLPADTMLLLVATEERLDAMLELRDGPQDAAVLADNPRRRLGPQRIVIPPGRARHVTIAGIGNEAGRGTLQVSLFSLNPVAPDCIAALRAVAAGDRAYASAQSIALGDVEAADVDQFEVYARAAHSYAQAIAAASRPGTLRAEILYSHAGTLYGSQKWPATLAAATAAVSAYRALGDEAGELAARLLHAMTLMEVAANEALSDTRVAGLYDEARVELRELADAFARRGATYDQALAFNNIGLSFYYQGSYRAAIPEYRAAQALHHALGERMREAQALQNIALIQLNLAQFAAARDSFTRALALVDPSTSPKLYADILNNHALSDLRTGHPDASLRRYSQALEMLERMGTRREQARSLHGIANVYRAIGNRRAALAYYQQAFERRSQTADFAGYLTSLATLAEGLSESGRVEEAIALRRRALEVAKTDLRRARIRIGLAHDQIALGALDDASASLASVIDQGAFGDPVMLALARMERARLEMARRNVGAARRDVAAARAVFSESQLAQNEFDALLLSAQVACNARDIVSAQRWTDAALVLAERLRRASSNPTLRASLWQPLRPAFDFSILLALEPERCGAPPLAAPDTGVRRALEIAERSRSRALEDFRQMAQRRAENPANATRERHREELFEIIADRRQGLESAADEGRKERRASGWRADIERSMRELDILDAAAGRVAEQGAVPAPVARQIEMIPPDTAVVEYWLGENRAYAWLVTRSRVQLFELGPSKKINDATRRLGDSMANFMTTLSDQRISNARDLHALVLAPLMPALRDVKAVYFVPDGSLHRVPFAALAVSPAGQPPRFVIDDHDVGIVASLAAFGPKADERPIDRTALALIVSDPVYTRDDERFAQRVAPPQHRAEVRVPQTLRSGGAEGFERLPGSARESDAVAALFAPASTERLSGFDASRDSLLSRDLSRFRILHLATHSVADLEAPQLSTLVMSTFDADGKAIPGEVFAGDLLGRHLDADLVVLSGCDSSLGQESAGEGLLGLRYAAHAAGARTVVASLWQVADIVGPHLMAAFYTRVTRERASPVAALSQAMREARERWRDPALWAVFQVSRAPRAQTLH